MELVHKLRKERPLPKALNRTRSEDGGKEYRLPVIEAQVKVVPQTRESSCLLDFGSELTIARPSLFLRSEILWNLWESRTPRIKLGFAPWEKVVNHFATLSAGIDVHLGLDSGLSGLMLPRRRRLSRVRHLSSES